MKNNINTLLNSLSNLGEIRKADKNIGEYSSESDFTMAVGTPTLYKRPVVTAPKNIFELYYEILCRYEEASKGETRDCILNVGDIDISCLRPSGGVQNFHINVVFECVKGKWENPMEVLMTMSDDINMGPVTIDVSMFEIFYKILSKKQIIKSGFNDDYYSISVYISDGMLYVETGLFSNMKCIKHIEGLENWKATPSSIWKMFYMDSEVASKSKMEDINLSNWNLSYCDVFKASHNSIISRWSYDGYVEPIWNYYKAEYCGMHITSSKDIRSNIKNLYFINTKFYDSSLKGGKTLKTSIQKLFYESFVEPFIPCTKYGLYKKPSEPITYYFDKNNYWVQKTKNNTYLLQDFIIDMFYKHNGGIKNLKRYPNYLLYSTCWSLGDDYNIVIV